MNDTSTVCEICKIETNFICRVVADQNGELIPDPVWCVECDTCGRTTAYYRNAEEARYAWANGERFLPIAGTGHFEEAW